MHCSSVTLSWKRNSTKYMNSNKLIIQKRFLQRLCIFKTQSYSSNELSKFLIHLKFSEPSFQKNSFIFQDNRVTLVLHVKQVVAHCVWCALLCKEILFMRETEFSSKSNKNWKTSTRSKVIGLKNVSFPRSNETSSNTCFGKRDTLCALPAQYPDFITCFNVWKQ